MRAARPGTHKTPDGTDTPSNAALGASTGSVAPSRVIVGP